MSSKFEIKATVTGAQQGADEIKKLGDAAGTTGKKIQDSGEQAAKATGKKNQLIDAFKKLKQEVPLVGAALDALKNPFTSLTLVIALAIKWLSEFNDLIEEQKRAIGDGKLADQLGNIRKRLAEAAVDGKKFSNELKDIAERAETVTEQVARLNAEMDRRLKIEAESDAVAKAAELAGVEDPAAKAAIEAKFETRAKQRDQRRLQGQANIQAQAQFRTRDAIREANAALPGALSELERRKAAADAAGDLRPVDTTAFETELQPLVNPSGTDFLKVPFRYGSAEAAAQRRRDLEAQIAGARNFNANIPAVQVKAAGALAEQQAVVDRLRTTVTSGLENERNFGIARTNAVADASAMQPFNDPGAAALLKQQREMQAAFEEYNRRMILMFNEGQRRVDAVSKANAAQAQQ